MDAVEFKSRLRQLGLSHSSPRTAELLGVQTRVIKYYAAGRVPVPPTVQVILRLLAAIPPWRWPDTSGVSPRVRARSTPRSNNVDQSQVDPLGSTPDAA